MDLKTKLIKLIAEEIAAATLEAELLTNNKNILKDDIREGSKRITELFLALAA